VNPRAKLRAAALSIILAWGWKRAGIALVAGVLSALAMAPFNAWPVLFLTFPVLVWLIDGAAAGRWGGVLVAAATGWWFGFGYFVAGLWWIGWAAAKLVLIVLLGLAGVLFGAGWLAGRVLWPGLCWAGRAVKLGYQEGRGRSHGPA